MSSLPPSCRLLAGSLLLSIAASANPSQLFLDWQSDPQSSILPDFSRAGFGEGDQLVPDVPEGSLPVFHVDDFGAVPDDGISDRQSIQTAIDAAAFAGGGIVKFSSGPTGFPPTTAGPSTRFSSAAAISSFAG